MSKIQNPIAKLWTEATLDGVLTQLEELPKMEVLRDNDAGTVICTGPDGREFLRGIETLGGWMMMIDSNLIQEKH